MKIPKIIHYCWFGSNEMSEREQECIASWKKYCPDYQFMCWGNDNYDYHKNEYMEQAALADKWSFVTDFVRLDVLYQYGGFYYDTDVEMIRSIEELRDTSAFIGFEQKDRVNDGQGIGSIPGNPLIKEMLDMYEHISFYQKDGSYNLVECPQYRTKCLQQHGLKLDGRKQIIEDMIIYPKDYFCPKDFQTGKIRITKNTYSIHHFRGSWHTEDELRGLYKMQKVKRILGARFGGLLLRGYFDLKHKYS